MPLGTTGLATLYAAHGSAMVRLLKAGRVPMAAEGEALSQVMILSICIDIYRYIHREKEGERERERDVDGYRYR